MGQVLTRLIELLRHPGIALPIVLVALGGSALVSLPLFNLPGYELGSAISIAVGTLGGAVGIGAAFQQQGILKTRVQSGLLGSATQASTAPVWSAFAVAALLNGLMLIPPLLSAFISSLTTQCSAFEYVGFYPVLAIPSAILAAAAGVFCGFSAQRWRWAVLLYALLVIGSILWTLWPIYFGPQVFAFNHFLGYFPGPLYDELLTLSPRLFYFRLETLAIGGLILAIGSLFAQPTHKARSFVACVLFAAPVAALEKNAERLGLKASDTYVAQQLGGMRDSEHFAVVYPKERKGEDTERLVRDLEFRHQQLTEFLGGAPVERIRVYLYRSAEEKQALVGAGHTQFSKPWRLEVHLEDLPFPHPTLKHELVHAMTAPFGSGLFRVTSRMGIWPLMEIVEGVAVAAEEPLQDLTLHEWTAAMRRQNLAPDVRALFRPANFYAQAHARAYTVAGSFIKYLIDTYGTDRFHRLYGHGDFMLAYQRSLPELAKEWEDFLDKLPVEQVAIDRAFGRFRQESLFSRTCAREVVKLSELASQKLLSDPTEAARLFHRCATLQPGEPIFWVQEATALKKLGRVSDAEKVLQAAVQIMKGRPALVSQLKMAQADLAWEQGDLKAAAAHLKEVIETDDTPATNRAGHIKLSALEPSTVGSAIWFYFQSAREDLKLLRLREALEAQPDHPFANYLLGRRLVQEGVFPSAIDLLDRALSGELPRSIRLEALRLKVQAEYLAGDCAAVSVDVGHLPDLGGSFKAELSQWALRCAFEKQKFNGPLVPENPFG